MTKSSSAQITAAITIDTDWASDDVIQHVADRLTAAQVKATWFVTHQSAAIARLAQEPELFEIGIHPNFLPGSSHGGTVEEVMDHLLTIIPWAQTMRTHSLYQSSQLFLTILEKYPQIKADVSLYLPYQKDVVPHKLHLSRNEPQRFLYRIPFVWEDDLEMLSPVGNFRFDPNRFAGQGIKIFNLHPIHIAMNGCDMAPYHQLKKSRPVQKVTVEECRALRNTVQKGTADFFEELLQHKGQVRFVHLMECIQEDPAS